MFCSARLLSQRFVGVVFIFATVLGHGQASAQEPSFLETIGAPKNVRQLPPRQPIVIAIVDDGVRITHRDVADFIWTNAKEIPNNRIDDDGNGYVDDIHGWDVSDANNDVSPPEGQEGFYHGTHLAGIITRIAKRAYGESASDVVQIMPVKSLADRTQTTYLKDAYKGIEYALDAGADIILTAWTVGLITSEESQILRRAEDRDVLIVASVGNFPEEREQFPAARPSVFAVAALNQEGQKSAKSNYGQFVDLSAPGEGIWSASALSDDGYEEREGTSFAAAMVAAAAAMVGQRHPVYSVPEITACLKSSSDPIQSLQSRYNGKLGAGKLNIIGALKCDLLTKTASQETLLVHPQNYIRSTRSGSPVTWAIKPDGTFKGLRFRLLFNRQPDAGGILEFRSGRNGQAPIIASESLGAFPEMVYVPGNTAFVTFRPENSGASLDWLLEYSAETIDFKTQYCEGTKKIREEGWLTDGSGPHPYAFNTDCKWIITAPEGKVVHFSFTEFDTEARRDWVYFFNGSGTHEKIMAIFSGPDIPPKLTTWRNQVLVWFVTNGEQQGQGWKVNIRFQDPDPIK